MAGIAKFKVIDYKWKYLKEAGYENIDNLNIHIPDNTFEGIIKKELEVETNEMLSCLKEKDRELFYKLYIEEKEIKDISFETGLKREVIYNRLTRGKKLYNDKYHIVHKNKDEYTTQEVTSYDLNDNDLSGELNIKISCGNVFVDDIVKEGEWKFEFNTNGEALKADTKEIALNNKVILENGEIYTLEKYTDNSMGQKIYATISNPIKESEYEIELSGIDNLGNRVDFMVKMK